MDNYPVRVYADFLEHEYSNLCNEYLRRLIVRIEIESSFK